MIISLRILKFMGISLKPTSALRSLFGMDDDVGKKTVAIYLPTLLPLDWIIEEPMPSEQGQEEGCTTPPDEKKQSRWSAFLTVEVIFLVLLLVTTFSSTFCAYEANNWNSLQSSKNREGTDLRTQSVRAYNNGNTHVIIDVNSFLAWANAVDRNDTRAADAVAARFTAEFKPAFAAWLAQAQGQPKGTIPPGTPFTFPEYHVSSLEQGALLEQNATASFNEASAAGNVGSAYVLNTLLYALVLFLVGVGERWKTPALKYVILATALILFAYATARLFMLPKMF